MEWTRSPAEWVETIENKGKQVHLLSHPYWNVLVQYCLWTTNFPTGTYHEPLIGPWHHGTSHIHLTQLLIETGEKLQPFHSFPKRLLDAGDQMVCLRMSLVASCYIWQCGLIWQVSVQFCSLQEGATGKIALGLISSLIRRTANISDKDIWWREVHSSRLASLEPELFSLDCFRQHAH